jgi:serine/threonine protein kinase
MSTDPKQPSPHDTALPGQPGGQAPPAPDEAEELTTDSRKPTVNVHSPIIETRAGSAHPGSVIGMSFGDFEVLEELGRGGMGVVYKAKQKSLDRLVALKMLHAGSVQNQTMLQRFLAEARSAAGLSHPNIVTVYQVGECPMGHYFAMEYIDGQSLESILDKGPVPIPWAANLIAAVAEAVNYAHGKGIIHRDLKPANIMIDKLRRPVVMDFGIAKVLGAASGLTQQGEIMGTPAYMAPEQARSGIVAIAPYTDVYSLGAILYKMLAGRYPFEEETTLDTLLKVISPEPPPPVRQFRPEVSAGLEAVVMRCLSKTPAERYQSARELSQDLRRQRGKLSSAQIERDKDKENSRITNVPSVLLVSVKSGKELRLFQGTITIGRSPECDLKLKAPDVSKKHCQLIIDGDKVVVEDLQSANGTYINDERIERRRLKDGDRLGIAQHDFEVRFPKKA